jgi:hypothetical protein
LEKDFERLSAILETMRVEGKEGRGYRYGVKVVEIENEGI